MGPDESDSERLYPSQPKDEALARSILVTLTEVERESMLRFYGRGETADQIEKALGLDAGYVKRLNRSVRARFFKERSCY